MSSVTSLSNEELNRIVANLKETKPSDIYLPSDGATATALGFGVSGMSQWYWDNCGNPQWKARDYCGEWKYTGELLEEIYYVETFNPDNLNKRVTLQRAIAERWVSLKLGLVPRY